MRKDVSNHIHAGHQGTTKCRSRAKDHVWWPGIGQEIQDMTPYDQKKVELIAGEKFWVKDLREGFSAPLIDRGNSCRDLQAELSSGGNSGK
ncbi:K02A2.6-like [Cordylochernes scorpioides]|uniref:K02A2.6-like n=1 Tax=Cordylochernes scorpioides TaxID=51811 RepID=A0ABY6JVE0_9ARAC|nr:K02A2.6-like [Cordylochernes scorpioides]